MLWIERSNALEELRQPVCRSFQLHNEQWFIERHVYRTWVVHQSVRRTGAGGSGTASAATRLSAGVGTQGVPALGLTDIVLMA